MSTNLLVTVVVPFSVVFIMWALGLSLKWGDFLYVKNHPYLIGVGLFVQLVLVPALAFLICVVFQLTPELSVGLMLLSATPGGPTANVFSYLSRGNVALNLTLTAVNSLVAVFYIPAMVFLAMNYFLDSEKIIPLQTDKIVLFVLLMIAPMAIGMLIRHYWASTAKKLEKYASVLSILFLILVIVYGVLNEKNLILTGLKQIWMPILIFNLGSLLVGYMVAKFGRLNLPEQTALIFELGIHNCAVALSVAISPSTAE